MSADNIQDIPIEELCRYSELMAGHPCYILTNEHKSGIFLENHRWAPEAVIDELIRRLRATVNPMDSVREAHQGKERADLP